MNNNNNMLEEFTERTSRMFRNSMFSKYDVKDYLAIGAGITVPLLIGYSINRYYNSQKLIEKVPWNQLVNGSNIIAKCLENNKIKHVFSLNELEFATLQESFDHLNIKVIQMKDVNNAITSAGGIYRMTKQVGIVFVTANTEMMTLINSVMNASSENIPLIIIGIRPIINSKTIDRELFNKFFKFTKKINEISDISKVFEASFNKVMEGELGPCFIEIGHDLLLPEEMTRKIYEKEEQVRGGSIWFNRIWNNIKLDFKYPSENSEIAFHYPKRMTSKIPSTREVNWILNKLLSAKTPLLILGDECLLNNSIENKELNMDSINLSIKSMGIPTYLHGFAKSLSQCSSADKCTLINDNLDYAIENSDFILTIGVSSPRFLKELKINYLKTSVYAIHEHEHSYSILEPVYNLSFNPNSFLIHLGFAFPKSTFGKWTNWLIDLREKDTISVLINEKKSKLKSDHINPYLLLDSLKTIFKSIEKAPIVISDNSQFAEKAQLLLGEYVFSWIQQSKLNTNPSAIGLAISTKLCYPDSEVWMICDNNTISQSVEEFETLSRYHLPINIVLGNIDNTEKLLPSPLSRTAYHKVMSAYGGKGFILSHNNLIKEDIEKSFSDARDKSLSLNKPLLFNCWIDQPKESLIGEAGN